MKPSRVTAIFIAICVTINCSTVASPVEVLRKRSLPLAHVADDVITHSVGGHEVRSLLHEVANKGKNVLEHMLSQGRRLERGVSGSHFPSSSSSSAMARAIKRIPSAASVSTPHASLGVSPSSKRKPNSPSLNKPKVKFHAKKSVRSYTPATLYGSNVPTRSTISVHSPHTSGHAADEEAEAAIKPLAERKKREQWTYSLHDHPYMYYGTVTGGLMAANAAIAHHYVRQHESDVLEAKKKLGLAPIDISNEIKEVKENLKAKIGAKSGGGGGGGGEAAKTK